MNEKDLAQKALYAAHAIKSVNRSRCHIVMVDGDDEPCYWQRKEWVEWMLEIAEELRETAQATLEALEKVK